MHRHMWTWAIVCLFFLLLTNTQATYSADSYRFEWTFTPNVHGSVHVELKVTVPYSINSYQLNFYKGTIRELKAYEVKTGNPVKITKTEDGKVHFKCEFDNAQKGFQFLVEFDYLNYVVEKENEVYSFHFGWTADHDTTHQAMVILPEKHELLSTEELNPANLSVFNGQARVTFHKYVLKSDEFAFTVIFSRKGIDLVEEGDSKFNQKMYNDAKRAYERAFGFYSNLLIKWGWGESESVDQLEDRVENCDMLLADEKVEEAMTAFVSKDYAAAQTLFSEAQGIYRSIEDAAKVSECQDFIDQCTEILELEKYVESQMDEGITYYDLRKYDQAKATFEEALDAFKKLEDEEKAQECQKWIDSCEKYINLIRGMIVLAIVAGAAVVYVVIRRRKNVQKGETEPNEREE
ncbi:MAG: hypothetical protein HXS46_09500 [Theionarchaea archaeon]|nr:hypothetical protein [Theionarchaea archaeon]